MTRYGPATPRKSRSRASLARIFLAAGGRCHICGNEIRDGEKWEAEHVVPLALGGADDESNLRPAHVRCHSEKTSDDLRTVHKRNRTIARGALKPSSRGLSKPPGMTYDWRARRYVKSEAAE